MRTDNYTQQQPLYLQYWIKKNIIVNAVIKNNKSIKTSTIVKESNNH